MGSDGSDTHIILATAAYDHTIKFWQASTGVCKRSIPHVESQVNAMEISPDKKVMAVASFQRVRMYDLVSCNPSAIINYEGVTKNVTAVGFHEDGKWMFTGGEDCSTRVWDLRARSFQCQRIFQVNAPVNCVYLHPNQSELYIGDQCGIIHIWDLKTNRSEQLIPDSDASIQCISINPEGNLMAAVDNKGNCYIWTLSQPNGDEISYLRPKKKLEAHQRYALKCKISPDSTLLVTTSADFTAKLWNTSDFSLVKELKNANQRWVWDAAFSCNSEYVITASSDNIARLWDVESGETRREYVGHQKAISCMAFRDVRL